MRRDIEEDIVQVSQEEDIERGVTVTKERIEKEDIHQKQRIRKIQTQVYMTEEESLNH